ncbi:MAG: metalloregulator ArsR/SmtB family transcription factor, partial [Chloroflexota bacterium]
CCEWISVGDIVEKTNVSQPTVSHHLAILREAGLVNVRHEGKQTFYSLNQERMAFCCGQLMVKFAPEDEMTEAVKQSA